MDKDNFIEVKKENYTKFRVSNKKNKAKAKDLFSFRREVIFI